MDVLAFFAHPDDETILAGGTLALLAEHGARVHYLCATRGEGGEVGDPPMCEELELGAVRERELTCAVEALGGASLAFLDYIDPRVGPGEELFAFTNDLDGLTVRLMGIYQERGPQVVVTHGSNGEYGHPAHVLAYQAAWKAARSLGNTPCLYTVAANFPDHPRPHLANPEDQADLVVDVAPALGRKEHAARCHRTQNALFVRRASQEAGRPLEVGEVLMSLEGLRRAHPPEKDGPGDSLQQFLEASGIGYRTI